MQARFTLAVLLGVVLLAAAACSSGGDDERIAELETDLEASEEARETAEREAAEAEQRADDAEDETADAEQRADAAEEEIADAEEEIADAEEEIAVAEEAQQQAQQQLEQAQQESEQLQQQLTEAEQAELRARAESFDAQLDNPVRGLATVEWKRGNNLTFRPKGIVMTPGSAAPSVPGSWRSASFIGQSGTATALIDETAYLYTNIQPPSSRAFWKVHLMAVTDRGLEVAASTAADLIADTANNDPKPTAPAQYITDSTDNAMATGVRVSGTYDGVSGTFTCTVNTCMGPKIGLDLTTLVGAPVDGVRSFAGGDWSFKPGSITTPVKAEDQADQDDAYLYFGVWSSIPDNIGPETAYDFRYVAGGGAQSGTAEGNVPALANFDALVGPATFRGGAVGKYVTRGQVGGQNAKIGTFTATATLNAHFGTDNVAGTLSGSITDFREGGSPLAGWRVTMGGGNDGNNVPDVGVAMGITGTAVTGGLTVANIGGLSVGGEWGATFYGSNNQELTDRDKYPASRYPPVDLAGVAGWFNAAGPGTDPNDVSLAGAFAATPQ